VSQDKPADNMQIFIYYQTENKINAALTYELAANIPLMKTAQ
jgi:hypothetical protein